MALCRNRTQAHGACAKAFDNFSCRLDLIEGNRFKNPCLKSEQTSECCLARRNGIGVLGEGFVGVATVGLCSNLEVRNTDGVPHVRVATAAPVNIARIG